MPYEQCAKCHARYYDRPDGTRPHKCNPPKRSYRGPRKERIEVQCVWLNCDQNVHVIPHPPKDKAGHMMYRLEAFHGAGLVRYPICESHRERMREVLGNDAPRNGVKAVVRTDEPRKLRRFINAPLVRLMIFDRAGGRCETCRNILNFKKAWHVDHRDPIYNGGSLLFDNVQALCANCHAEKTRLEQSHASKRYWRAIADK